METKNIIYTATIAISLLFALSLLVLYYTQSFDEDAVFVQRVSHLDLEITQSMRGNVEYLVSAKGEVGTLTLDNEGVFSEVYTFPQFVGCINLRQGVSLEQSKITNYQFAVNFLQNGMTYYPGTRLEIPIGKTSTYQIIGEYAPYNVPLYAFDGGIIDSVSIYRLETSENNPIYTGEYYYDYYQYGYDNCNILSTQQEPEARIIFS